MDSGPIYAVNGSIGDSDTSTNDNIHTATTKDSILAVVRHIYFSLFIVPFLSLIYTKTALPGTGRTAFCIICFFQLILLTDCPVIHIVYNRGSVSVRMRYLRINGNIQIILNKIGMLYIYNIQICIVIPGFLLHILP